MFVVNGFYAGMQWVQLSLITKFCTGYELGAYTLSLALTAPVFLFLGMQLRALLVTDSKKEWEFSSYFFLRSIMMFAALFICAGISFYNFTILKTVLLVAVLKMVEGYAEIFNAQQQLLEKMHYVALSLILKGVFATMSIFIGVYLFDSLLFGLGLAIFTNCIVLFFNDYRNCRKNFEGRRFIYFGDLNLRSLFWKAFPLGVVMLIISLNTNVSKYIIEIFLGTEEQGLYSTLAYCIVLGNFVNTAIGQSFSPRLSKYFANRQFPAFKKLTVSYLSINFAMGFILFIFGIWWGEDFLRLMFNEKIAGYHDLFNLIMFSAIFLYVASACGFTLTAMRVFKIQPYVNGAVLIVSVLGSIYFLKNYGIYGIPYASILAYGLKTVINSFLIRKHYIKKSILE
ncbi:MAG: oligosaccharide flippase family protein [Alistipes sp.]|nr:oligosaccharide flippase family protein [Alistipes sp.]